MDFDPRVLVLSTGAVILALSYIATYLMGKNAARREHEARERLANTIPRDRMERIEAAVDSIALEVERLAEGQRYLLKSRPAEQRMPSPIPQRRPTTPT